MVHTNTTRAGAPAHLYIVRAPAGESPFDGQSLDPPPSAPSPVRALPRPVGPYRPTPATHGALALAAPPAPVARPALHLVPPLEEPDPAEARSRARRLAWSLAEIMSGLRAITQLRPHATAAVYAIAHDLTRRLAHRRVGRVSVQSCDGSAPADGIAEGYARLHAATWVLTLAYRLERDVPARRPSDTWLCTALEHDRRV